MAPAALLIVLAWAGLAAAAQAAPDADLATGATGGPVIRLAGALRDAQPAGDVDGDGHADAVSTGGILFGGPGVEAYGLGLDAGGRTLDLGPARAVGAGGDVDGDGLDDVVLAGDDGLRLVHGPGLAQAPVDGLPGAPAAVDVVPDLDGDGRDDVAIGVPDAGRVVLLLADRRVLLTGPRGAGTSVAGLGDVNGDGLGDLAVGAGAASGRAFVVFGGRDLAPVTLTALGARGFAVAGPGVGGQVAGLGDFDGDGRGDLLLASHRVPDGRGYLVYGKATTSTVTVGAAGSTGLRFDGAGATVREAGDVNGDGLGDALLGAAARDRVFVAFGRRARSSVPLAVDRLGAGGYAILGGGPGFGSAPAAYGDLDGDGRPDVGGPGAALGIPCDVLGSPGDDVLSGTAGTEVVCGRGGDDVLAAGAGNDTVLAGPGDDRLAGGPGADVLDGGDGADTADYAAAATAVTVTLDDQPLDGAGERDNVRTTVEGILGGRGADRLTGGPGDDSLDGGPGNDRLDGLGGADDLRGGAGVDAVSYAARRTPVAVTLDAIAQDGADVDRDGVAEERDLVGADVETVVGGPGGDWLAGGDGGERLEGLGGNDRLAGGAGDDVLLAGPGDDVLLEGPAPSGRDSLNGGAGTDVADYAGRREPLQIDLDGAADDGAAGELDDVGPTIETLLAGAGADTLTATSGVRVTVRAGAGDDAVTVRDGGVDTVECGSGTGDVVTGDAAEARLDGCEQRPGLAPATVHVDPGSLGGACDDARELATVAVDAPVCGLDRAVELVPDGGVVVLREGAHPRLTVTRAGARTTTYEAFAGERPSVDGIRAPAGASGHRVEGLVIRDVTELQGTRIELVGNEVTPHGIVLHGSSNLVAGNDIHDLTMRFDPDRSLDSRRCHSNWRPVADGGENPDADGDGIADIALTATGAIAPRCGHALRVHGSGHVVRGNRFARIPADGIQAYRTAGLVVEANAFETIVPFVDPLEHSDGIQLIGTNERTVIRANTFYDTRGIFVMARQERRPATVTHPDDVLITGNAGYNDRNLPLIGNGCIALSAGTRMTVTGNTCWSAPTISPGKGIRLYKDGDRGRLQVVVRDNITLEMTVNTLEGVQEDFNLVGAYRVAEGLAFTPGPNSLLGVPTFEGDERRLQLAEGSLGLDGASPAAGGRDRQCLARVPGGVPGAASLPDLGAHERGGTPGPCAWQPGGTAP